MLKDRKAAFLLIAFSILLVAGGTWLILSGTGAHGFSGERAFHDVETQLAFGPRVPGTPAHQAEGDWILAELEKAGWSASEQVGSQDGHPLRNLVGKRGSGSPWIILGAHYDSRKFADRDAVPAWQTQPVPGANDGASGVAVLLELARSLPDDLAGQIWLVFFDLEDQGDLPGAEWILGSTYFAANLEGSPDAVVVVDMVGDASLEIYQERGSDRGISQAIWDAAGSLGYSRQFKPEVKYELLDDHLPFLKRGIPAVLVIDFDYPAWHTTADNLGQVSAGSLSVVGKTLFRWLILTLAK